MSKLGVFLTSGVVIVLGLAGSISLAEARPEGGRGGGISGGTATARAELTSVLVVVLPSSVLVAVLPSSALVVVLPSSVLVVVLPTLVLVVVLPSSALVVALPSSDPVVVLTLVLAAASM